MDDKERTAGPTAADRLSMDEQTWFELHMSANGSARNFNDLRGQLVKAALQGQTADQEKQLARLLEDLDEAYSAWDTSCVLAAFAAGWYMANCDPGAAEESTEKEIADLRTYLEEYRETVRARLAAPDVQSEGGRSGLKLV